MPSEEEAPSRGGNAPIAREGGLPRAGSGQARAAATFPRSRNPPRVQRPDQLGEKSVARGGRDEKGGMMDVLRKKGRGRG